MAATSALIAALFFALAVTLEERLSRPAWHVGVALIGLGLAFVGAIVICLSRQAAEPDPTVEPGAGVAAVPIHARDT
jgi:drug/metabolite transporter (DMT)-like permease